MSVPARVDQDQRDALDSVTDAEQWLYQEARLLDERRFEEWLALFADDLVYWVPTQPSGTDPRHDISIVYDDRTRLAERIVRAESSSAHCEDPPTRTCRLVTNVQLEVDGPTRRRLRSNVLVATLRRDIARTYVATVEHELRAEHGAWRVTRRVVDLLEARDRLRHVPFLI